MVLRRPVGAPPQRPAGSTPYPSNPMNTAALIPPQGPPPNAPVAELADTSSPHELSDPEFDSLRNEDTDSDWDASDREDETAHNKTTDLPPSLRIAGPSQPLHNPSTAPPPPPAANKHQLPPPLPLQQQAAASVDDQLHVQAQGLSLASEPKPPPSPRSNTNPFRRDASNEHLQTSTAELAPNNPFRRQPSSSSAETPLISFDDHPDHTTYPNEPSPSPLPPPATVPVQSTGIAPANLPPLAPSHPVASAAAIGVPPETPTTRSQRQRNEVYQIRNIRWKDATAHNELRDSPVLIQNANGPCPLLALVNALVLSTPPGEQTALIETLKTREHVSLGLLLDAVFDELMSGRRGNAAGELPDVDKLYSFLLALHTGMNVNPRFVSQSGEVGGGFEATKEMQLYGAFELPLLHGWLPAADEAAYAAFARSAPTYEDTQNLLFREEELERELQQGQLGPENEAAFIDLTTIKQFLTVWPTQLTDHGLASLHESIKSCQVAILFRNDHFSTLYKEPAGGRLMALVTDAGYAPHAEVVWESLQDINGSQSEFFSGDFRSVSHVNTQGRAQATDGEGWTTVEQRSTGRRAQAGAATITTSQQTSAQTGRGSEAHARSASEQEDHDFALAMQLQEEEEERQRNEQAARRREEQLSQQFLSQDSSNRNGGAPTIPPRRSQQSTSPALRATDTSTDGAPPTYEQARHDAPYVPASEQPRTSAARRTGGPIYAPPDSAPPSQGRRGRRGPIPLGGSGSGGPQFATMHDATADRREGCVVM